MEAKIVALQCRLLLIVCYQNHHIFAWSSPRVGPVAMMCWLPGARGVNREAWGNHFLAPRGTHTRT